MPWEVWKKLNEEEVEEVLRSISRDKLKELFLNVGNGDMRKLFNKSSLEEVTISRSYLEQTSWLLRPSVASLPLHVLHVDSYLDVIFGHGCERTARFPKAIQL